MQRLPWLPAEPSPASFSASRTRLRPRACAYERECRISGKLTGQRALILRLGTASVLAFVAVITCTFDNLAAYGQTNIKRLLAYSTIAQAGYMIMPVPAAMVLSGSNPDAASKALASMAFYAGVYLFMNLGAFAVVAFLPSWST